MRRAYSRASRHIKSSKTIRLYNTVIGTHSYLSRHLLGKTAELEDKRYEKVMRTYARFLEYDAKVTEEKLRRHCIKYLQKYAVDPESL